MKNLIENYANAAVYVGTYNKYNNGSLEGQWLKFSDYSDSEDFMTACDELHADELENEFMFQDSEYLPDFLYSESLSQNDIDKIYQYLEVAEKIENSDWVSLWNTYCSENSIESELFDFDDDFFDTFFEGKPYEAARATAFGNVNFSHDYIYFNGYANLETTSNEDDIIDYDELICWLIEHPESI